MAEFASKGVAGSGLGLGIAGTALGLLNNGSFGGLFNNMGNCGCSENHFVNRYELGQEQKIADLTADKKLLESTIYTNEQLNQFRNYVLTAEFGRAAGISVGGAEVKVLHMDRFGEGKHLLHRDLGNVVHAGVVSNVQLMPEIVPLHPR